ncbi:DUF6776 family protein [Candidatus Symbiobacter mobilis]|uniref:Uncharacterized protein n=1 Tax=Candidatus Symbiobacter mobilis CR TaxID=946483 RepID=U5NB13_9BURK|nr:DUF6776 family protein [Candidatus Symbiobacter mobilis]AGX87349.1 hypothetical protein Cenrod_1257 [Candidatus Symbiobacter mobilis CR]
MFWRTVPRRYPPRAVQVSVCAAWAPPWRWAALLLAAAVLAATLWGLGWGDATMQQLRQERDALRERVTQLEQSLHTVQAAADAARTLQATQRAAQEQWLAVHRAIEAENHRLREDLAFFERLIPASGAPGLSIRGLQAQKLASGEWSWQVLVMQSAKNPSPTRVQLALTFSGRAHGKPWSAGLASGLVPLEVVQYVRRQGVFRPPANAVLQQVTARVYLDGVVRAERTIPL